MKKLVIGALIAISAISFASCNNSGKTTHNAPEPTQVEEQVPLDDEVTTMDNSAFSADLAERTDKGSAYCYEITDICNQLANNPYNAPSKATSFAEYMMKFKALEYTDDEMAMMSDEQLEIASTWNSALENMEMGCNLLSQGCVTMDADTISQANHYFDLASDILNK